MSEKVSTAFSLSSSSSVWLPWELEDFPTINSQQTEGLAHMNVSEIFSLF